MINQIKLLIDAGLNVTQAGVIACAPIGNIRLIAQDLGLNYPAVRASVCELVKGGWITYDKDDELRIRLTPKGLDLKVAFSESKV